MSSQGRTAVFWAVLICVGAALWMVVSGRHTERKVTYSECLASVQSGQVASVTILGSNAGAVTMLCRLKDGSTEGTVLASDYRDALCGHSRRNS